MASALLSAGLTWYQALFICVLGHTLVLIPPSCWESSAPATASFPVLSKMVFGPKGTAIPTIIRAFMGCLWFGIQNWIGGTALDAIITVIFPAYTGLAFHSFLSFGLFVLINFYIGYHGSRAIPLPGGFRRPHPDHSQRRSHCLGLLAGQSEGRICRTVHPLQVAGGNGESFWSPVLPSPDFHDRL